MDLLAIYILQDITSNLYHKLIDFSVGRYPLFLFVKRYDVSPKLKQKGEAVIQAFSPFLKDKLQLKEWPGTRTAKEADVFYYHLTHQSAKLLKQNSRSLYTWLSPDLPDDMCIMRNMRQPWLRNTSHENFATFFIAESEMEELINSIPELKLYLGYGLIKLKIDVFFTVIDYAQKTNSYISIVVHDKHPSSEKTKEFIDKMTPFFVKKEIGNDKELGQIRIYDCIIQSKNPEVVKQAANLIHNWIQPDFSGNLCFLYPNREPWLVFDFRRRISYIPLVSEEKNKIFNELPYLKSYIDKIN